MHLPLPLVQVVVVDMFGRHAPVKLGVKMATPDIDLTVLTDGVRDQLATMAHLPPPHAQETLITIPINLKMDSMSSYYQEEVWHELTMRDYTSRLYTL